MAAQSLRKPQEPSQLKSRGQSALVVLVPEAEGLVKPFRDRFDPSAAKGMPAHITILYPFKLPHELTPALGLVLAELFARSQRFDVSLSNLGRFPDALYLAPSPEGPLRRLTQLTVERFPEHPPYEGEFAEIIPHMTIAQLPEPDHLDDITVDFQRAAHGRLPIRAAVRSVALMDSTSGRWQVNSLFELGGQTAP
jgi:2'-5' RNA ligase